MGGIDGFVYESLQPTGQLADAVESIWYARGTVPYRRERISPTGSTVAVIVLGADLVQTPDDGRGRAVRSGRGLLVGPHVGPIVNEPTGETHAVGIVTTSVGAGAALGIAPAAVRGAVVELERAWPAASRLRSRLLEEPTPERCLRLVADELARTTPALDAREERCQRAVRLLESHPGRPIAELAAQLGISAGHLGREFTRVVGLSPLALARLLRLRRLLAALDAGSTDWGALAVELGWYDQSHLIRDFRRHTGVTPDAYRSAVLAHVDDLGAAEGVGFAPDAEPDSAA